MNLNKLLAFFFLLMLPALGAPIELTTATDAQINVIRATLRARAAYPPLVVTLPVAFTQGPSAWTPPFTIIRNRDGTFSSTKRAIDLKSTGGITLRVDGSVTGGTGDGSSWTNAYSTLAAALAGTAYTTIPTPSSPATILIRPGRYGLTKSMAGQPLLRHTNLIGVEGTPELTAATYGDEVTWTDESPTLLNVWSTPFVGANGFNMVMFDEGNLDANGSPIFVTEASSLGNVPNLANSHYVSGNKLYVRMVDATKPGSRLAFSRNDSEPNAVTSASDGFNLYCENINFAYGNHAFHTAGNSGNTVFNRCGFFGGYNKGHEGERAVGLTWLEECRARRCGQDGFSYRLASRSVEINCEAFGNGYYGAGTIATGSNNGSTAHDTARVVRLNGRYYYNAHRNVHDITSSRSFNCGVSAGYALVGGSDPYESSDFVAGYTGDGGTGALMWLVDAYSEGSVGNYNCYGVARMYQRDCSPGLLTGNGSFQNF